MLWHIGNTTVRTPYRLREALIVLRNSSLNGNINGREQENKFAASLHEKGILNADRIAKNEDVSDLGRKWRAALSQLGFVTPKLSRAIKDGSIDQNLLEVTKNIEILSGRPYEVTPNGNRLADSETTSAQQECFLRSLISYKIPSIIEGGYECSSFSPLQFILDIFHKLKEDNQNEVISFNEYALFIQTDSPDGDIKKIITSIITYRKLHEALPNSKRKFDQQYYKDVAEKIGKKESTLRDYADLSFRYLKATGLFASSGRGISISSPRQKLVSLLQKKQKTSLSDKEYLLNLWNGAALPTDNKNSSYLVLQDLVEQLAKRGVIIEGPSQDTPLKELEIERHRLEEKILQLNEKDYAKKQSESIEDIILWTEAIIDKKDKKSSNGDNISIPRSEAPAYLEWIVWRAFLAINSLHNEPWEARRFNIDQDFLPISTAPGNGPDMVFEFEDAIVVVEVTLTSSSRQEAAEGEPVRRHVAKYVENGGEKAVFGLFMALSIDSNTAHTFRLGDWYRKDDTKISLDIVPITLKDFLKIMVSSKERLSAMPQVLKQILIECRSKANQDAPQWKNTISTIIDRLSKS